MHIESAPSQYNPHLYVSLRRGRYQLCTAHAVYSYEDRYDNFVKAFKKANLGKRDLKNVLILGFGLGSIPIILEKQGHSYYYTAVEIDEEVLYLANKYSMPEMESNIQLICTDAHAFVMQHTEKYDMICMDIFLDDTVPSIFEEEPFLERLKELLNPKGLLLYNRLAANPDDVKKTKTFFENQFSPVFPKGQFLDVGGNWILLNQRL
jgi:spermidine synthase